MHVTADGQVPIPPEIRQQLGLLPGTEVEMEVLGDTLLKKKSTSNRERNLIALMQGKASTKLTTDEIMALTRSEQ